MSLLAKQKKICSKIHARLDPPLEPSLTIGPSPNSLIYEGPFVPTADRAAIPRLVSFPARRARGRERALRSLLMKGKKVAKWGILTRGCLFAVSFERSSMQLETWMNQNPKSGIVFVSEEKKNLTQIAARESKKIGTIYSRFGKTQVLL